LCHRWPWFSFACFLGKSLALQGVVSAAVYRAAQL
jgi:hypothetical protein